MSKIDIIMPTYNQCDFLPKVIEYVESQTFKDFTFIIVNDRSSDYTYDILETYKNKENWKIIHNEKNKGLPVSLNIGHKAGNSPYCTWISTDNKEYTIFLEKLYNKIIEGFDFVQACYIVKSETYVYSHNKPWENKSNWGYGALGTAFLYKREVWEMFNYDENLECIEDLKFYLQAYLHGYKFGYVEDFLAEHLSHNNSLSATKVSGHTGEHNKKIEKVYNDVVKPFLEKK